ncbi:DmsC/YnfH family molybdoenzyme membrane anchor subunit [Gallibacterium anatis]|uniref:DmsC/YnfH family molybdoenzyme membrane anchor subunit n=1 Tax=Gallibacterium anatis TaxID=750 RepID=UPI000BA0F549|nr:DmsC/YnfH family molybdoenzyme membrane anchor subunit [Gallibacterium anatis]WAX71069.1 dimethyl sulfoxide reductase anchor subunit [Gallibacterium anatis]
MNAGLLELPLVFFTVLAQAAVGTLWVFAYVLWQKEAETEKSRIYKLMFLPLVLLGIGFIASILHLGTPIRAFNSLNRVGESMLSNEIASGALFFAIAGFYWLIAIIGKMPSGLSRIWLVVMAISGAVFMYMMNNVYHIDTVPTWNNTITSWQFYLTVVLMGTALGYALLHPIRPLCLLPWLFGLAMVASVAVVIYQSFTLASIHSAVQQAINLVPEYVWLNIIRLLCLVLANLLLCKSNHRAGLLFAVLLVFGGEVLGRIIFYGLHMTVGMAV